MSCADDGFLGQIIRDDSQALFLKATVARGTRSGLHAMEPFPSFNPIALDFLRAGTLVLVFLSGLFTAFMSQASSPDYLRLFWSILPIAAIHAVLAVAYFLKVAHWTRWTALCFAIITLGFLGELTLRVWS